MDPRVNLDIGALARTGLSLTLARADRPVHHGLGRHGLDEAGRHASGRLLAHRARLAGAVLRLEYGCRRARALSSATSASAAGAIEWGGQIAEHVTCTVGGVAGTRGEDEARRRTNRRRSSRSRSRSSRRS